MACPLFHSTKLTGANKAHRLISCSLNGTRIRDCKLDLKSPGTLLLRDPNGLVHYLAFSSLSQVGEYRRGS
eukprot:scaffold308169_cov17-Tisochrysis_lutea.AAC.1